ncbi:class I SAM-dependent methyltransferase [Cryobacterium sp. BB307]|uniref:class I SAM-dependent methyltransferase n=1 Tax=Cryobacterium sp. BB307 TaxID=2716317 RepID=UPI0014470BC1|nr:class I SAM-dependent methyltransferase [Cryobacterium sp. BB307]
MDRTSWQDFDQLRGAAIGALRGTVLELGAGSGANFEELAPGVRWIGLEPSVSARRELRRNATGHGHTEPPLAAGGENIPLEDGSVDAVFSTYVLCSVDDVDRVLREVRRVLKPGGTALFIDHVAAPPQTWRRRLQDLASPITRRVSGCRWNRDVTAAVEASGLETVRLDRRDVASGRLTLAVPCTIHEVVNP